MNIKLDNKLEAEQAYLNAKKTIEEIRQIQQRIEKLITEIKDLCFGFDPKKIVEGQK